jgi:hypothetical protein
MKGEQAFSALESYLKARVTTQSRFWHSDAARRKAQQSGDAGRLETSGR